MQINDTEARFALDSVARSRRQVLDEADVPMGYWVTMAAGWAGLGLLEQFGPVWAVIAGMVLFGAGHAAIAPRVLTGRRPSSQVRIRRELADPRLPLLAIAFIVAMTAATVGLALLFDADGARHPAALAGGVVALVVLCGGPAIMHALRRRRPA